MKKRNDANGSENGLSLRLSLRMLMTALAAMGCLSIAHAAPEGGVVRAGSAQILGQGATTLIQQSSPRAVIDWRGFGIQPNEQVRFDQPSASSATLNRVTGGQVSVILGRMDANGQVLLINPNGIIFGGGAQINVGSLIASTANLSNENFMQGKLVFDQPGRPGAGIVNSGRITAADGGLVALVAPHVRNDGLIQARLGKVTLGAADTFTIDLYGDGLVNLALREDSLAQLMDAEGRPIQNLIAQAGTINVGGGQAVLVTAEAAKGMLDSLINMSGMILADSAIQEGGRIVLSARGGGVDVSGELSAQGTTGGQIEVLGDRVSLASTTKLNADGDFGGGTLHVGGAYQGGGDTYRSQSTQVEAGAVLQASALAKGDGGEVVVWSDVETAYAGSTWARGGAAQGDGGKVEVSGKRTLFFNGQVDAGAAYGKAGSLLLDPYDFTIGMAEASLINRVIRTGTSTSVSADNDLFVNYFIDGRGRYTGGGLTLSAGNNINVNDHIITNNGAINLYAAAGAVNLAPGRVVYAGMAPITVRSGADLYMAPYLTGGLLSLISTQKSVFINQGIDASIGNLFIQAAEDVNINQPIVSHSDGNSVNVSAGNDINVNGQIDGRPDYGLAPDGSVTLTATQNINLLKSILAHSLDLTASLGTINSPTMTAGTVTINETTGIPEGVGLFAGNGPISVTSGGDLSSGIYVTTGPVSLRSKGGNIHMDTKLAEILGDVTIKSDVGSVHVDQEIANIRSGSNLTITAGTDINLNRQINALDDTNPLSITPVPGGSVNFTSGRNLNVRESLVTYNAPIDLYAAAGMISLVPDKVVYAGTAPIAVRSSGDMDIASYLMGGALSLTSTQGSVHINQGIGNSNGELLIQAAADVNINQPILSHSDGNSVNVSAGNDINVNAQIDGRPGPDVNPNGEVAMTAGRNINLYKSILANSINLTANLGTIYAPTMTADTVFENAEGIPEVRINSLTGFPYGGGLFSGTGPISVTAGGDLSSGIYVTTGPVSLRSTGGHVNVDTKLAEILGDVTIKSDVGSVNVDQEIANIRSGSNLTITAGTDINLNRQIDALDDNNPLSITPLPGGIVTFTAGNNVNLNRDLVTYNGPVNLAADITGTTGKLNIVWNDSEKRTYRVQSGSAPISVTTGGDLSTGPKKPPTSYLNFPVSWDSVKENYWDDLWISGTNYGSYRYADYVVDQLKRYVAFSTADKLSLTSTGGNVNVDAPIPNTTGEVSMTAASSVTFDDTSRAVIAGDKGIIVNHKVFSNNQPITLTAGSGGITVNPTNDNYGLMSFDVNRPAIDSGSGPLTLRATGDISITPSNGIATSNVLTIDTRSKILQGIVNEYVGYRPSKILLNADKGINSFYAGSSPIIDATSSNGAINLTVFGPGTLTVNAPSATSGDVAVYGVHGQIGNDVKITAGRDIGLSDVTQWGGTLHLTAGRDANLNILMLSSLYVKASSIYFNSNESFPTATIWLNGDLTAISTGNVANPIRPLTTGDILFKDYSAVHIEGGKSLALDAYKSVELGFLESLGPVSITAQNGNIRLRNDIGPPIQFFIGGNYYKYVYVTYSIPHFTNDLSEVPSNVPYYSSFDPDGIGVASLYLKAFQGDISMQGASAKGSVEIYAGGKLEATNGIFSGTPSTTDKPSIKISADGGAWLDGKQVPVLGTEPAEYTPYVFENTPTNPSFGTTKLAAQAPLEPLGFGLPVPSPGPAVAPPGLPGALTALPAQPPDISSVFSTQPDALTALPAQTPGLASVTGYALPPDVGAPITPGPEQEVEANRLAANLQLSEIIPVEDEEGEAGDEEDDEWKRKNILKISDARGARQMADRGSDSRSTGVVP